jgi:hypothetical protein
LRKKSQWKAEDANARDAAESQVKEMAGARTRVGNALHAED